MYLSLAIVFTNIGITVLLSNAFLGNIALAILNDFFFLLFAFALRAYDDDNLESFNESVVRFYVSAFLSFLFVISVVSIFDFNVSKYNILYLNLLLPIALSVVNNILFKISLKTTKPKKYLVIGRQEELKPILDEITQKSKGRYVFADFINPSPVTFRQKVIHYDNVLIGDYELYERIKDEIQDDIKLKNVEYLSELSEKLLKRIPIAVIQKFKEYYELEFSKAKESPAKRLLDIIGGTFGLILFSPFMLITAIAILIEDGRPVVFKQLRVGKDGKYFEFIKLRSLKNDGFDSNNPNGTIEKRLLKIGKVIRSTRIDESLQFWLILKGKMSLVGPRPEMIEYHRLYSQQIPFYEYRLKLKPGLTGWAQINFKHTTTLEEYMKKTEYDLYYVKNRSTLMDLRIILQTIEVIFWRKGAK
ncbi:sugar transferase [Fervidobacterium nodosum]|uniref:Sugar transferase n=1 Tax=Fervidobacterium nodosum (strain ATCC 35602 / DSM 5306 / Rt17-B1) TaxID=381764 RepID=A7HKK1_FERNB|nr:sugar transferase [Fervidobacterium nodosum]ABS60434.1 sugar transferase [Fervidobacterium nodosum Rt17-B1]